jgi:alkanesulfonate monooxygenase SsuD/methylene tetrahydromethanopterin reductase-like flavin-dependent oxidoreductase (luciferase family)
VQVGVTIPSRTAHISAMAEYARLADNAGFDSAWHYEVFKNPFTMLALGAAVTERVTLATGLASAFSRSPFEAANAAADHDELSYGRMVLGIGTGVPEFLTAFHSTDGRKPLSRISEYIDVLRLSWRYLGSGARENYEGAFYGLRHQKPVSMALETSSARTSRSTWRPWAQTSSNCVVKKPMGGWATSQPANSWKTLSDPISDGARAARGAMHLRSIWSPK